MVFSLSLFFPPQGDITKCVVSTDPSFHSHWLVAAAFTCAHYLKAIVFYLLREKWRHNRWTLNLSAVLSRENCHFTALTCYCSWCVYTCGESCTVPLMDICVCWSVLGYLHGLASQGCRDFQWIDIHGSWYRKGTCIWVRTINRTQTAGDFPIRNRKSDVCVCVCQQCVPLKPYCVALICTIT